MGSSSLDPLAHCGSDCVLHATGVVLQRWKRQAREYRQKQLLSLDKPKHSGRLHVPDIARGVAMEDIGDPQVYLLLSVPSIAVSLYFWMDAPLQNDSPMIAE